MTSMETIKRRWFNLPSTVRKPLVLILGMVFVIVSPFTGVLPGPGGIPIFLIGIAILSTEFEWAQRLREWTLSKLRILGHWWRQHKILGSLIFALAFAAFAAASYFGYRYVKTLL